MEIGPSFVLAALMGIFWTSAAVLVRGVAGARLAFLLLLAVTGAWAGDAIGGRLGGLFDLLRIGDFRVLPASIGALAGILLSWSSPCWGRRGRNPGRGRTDGPPRPDLAPDARRGSLRSLRAGRDGRGVRRRRHRRFHDLAARPTRAGGCSGRRRSDTRDPAPVRPARRRIRRRARQGRRRDGYVGARPGPASRGAGRDRGPAFATIVAMPSLLPTPEPDPRITPIPAAEIRRRYLEFFAARGHTVVPGASLVPAGDQTLLFTNSGMVQFKEVFTGAETRSYTRAVDVQRCLRVAGKHNNFEEVGRTPRHHTLFEMMGNWSFGDYFKREAIHWAWEFLTVEMGLPAERLAATTYRDDEVAWAAWRDEIGLPPERMARWGDVDAGDDKNFWRMADTGPCGPCSEIHFDRGPELSEGPECVPDHSEHCPRWLELWNLVFMEFNQLADGRRVPLPFTSVDTGLGLERLASVLQGVLSNYDTDLFTPIHETLRRLLGHDPEAFEADRFSYQVIADHSRAMTFLIADGVLPSNKGRGYVLRRIIRRAVRHGRLLGRRDPFLVETAAAVIDVMGDAYPMLRDERERILAAIAREEVQFARTLDAGTLQLEEALIPLTDAERLVGRRPEDVPPDAPVLPGAFAFRLHDTYGFPIDLTIELAAEYGVQVDRAGFDVALEEQRQRSRGGRKAELARHAQLTDLYEGIQRRAGETLFLGYETTAAEGRVLAIVRDGTLSGMGGADCWRLCGRP